MSYVALHYVKIKSRIYMPAEIIEEALDSAVAERLLGKGAIREEAPSGSTVHETREETRHAPVTASEETAEADEEADDAALIPEINAMDGIVTKKKHSTRGRKA